MPSCHRPGLREDLMHIASPQPRQVGSLAKREHQFVHRTMMACRPPTNFEYPIAELYLQLVLIGIGEGVVNQPLTAKNQAYN